MNINFFVPALLTLQYRFFSGVACTVLCVVCTVRCVTRFASIAICTVSSDNEHPNEEKMYMHEEGMKKKIKKKSCTRLA